MNIAEMTLDGIIKNTLPSVLVEYLFKVVRERTSVYGIRLVPEKLGSGEIQDILLETADGTTMLRVFGFSPVTSELKVERSTDKITLLAAN